MIKRVEIALQTSSETKYKCSLVDVTQLTF